MTAHLLFNGPFSRMEAFDDAIRTILLGSLEYVLDAVRPWKPVAVVLLGSTTVGEAVAVGAPGGLLPLSDVDLAAVTSSPLDFARLLEIRRGLAARFEALSHRVGLLRSPVDFGVFHLSHLRRTPPSLEVAAAATGRSVLWGDPGVWSDLPQLRHRFEAFRLLVNRAVEVGLMLGIPGSWATDPDPTWWQRGHWCAKMVVDLSKARLAAQGRLVASVEQRLSLLRQEGVGAGCEPAFLPWYEWRLSPVWPPPRIDVRVLAAEWLKAVSEVLEVSGGADSHHMLASLKRVLPGEGGSWREMLRRWRRYASAAGGVRALRGLTNWLGCWPASVVRAHAAVLWAASAAGEEQLAAAALKGLRSAGAPEPEVGGKLEDLSRFIASLQENGV